MNKYILALIVVLMSVEPAEAGIPVSIIANAQGALEHIDRIRHYYEELKKLQAAVEQAKKTTNALSGVRNLGDVFNNPLLRQYFPREFANTYRAIASEGYEGLLENGRISYALNQVFDNCQMIKIHERKMHCQAVASKPSQDQAIATDLYMKTIEHAKQITELQNEINKTEDMKAISELQARIAIETTSLELLSSQMVAANAMSESQDRVNRQIDIETNGEWFQSKERLKLTPIGG